MESKKENQEEEQKQEEEKKVEAPQKEELKKVKSDLGPVTDFENLTEKFSKLKLNEVSGIPIDPDFLKRVNEVKVPSSVKVEDYKVQINGRIFVEVVKNDITKETSEAVTNAANSHLIHAGGLAAAIARKGGKTV